MLETASYEAKMTEHFPQFDARLMDTTHYRSIEIEHEWIRDEEVISAITFAPMP